MLFKHTAGDILNVRDMLESDQLPCVLRDPMEHTKHHDERALPVPRSSLLGDQSCASSPTEVALVLVGWEWFQRTCNKMNQSKGSEKSTGASPFSVMPLRPQKREAKMPTYNAAEGDDAPLQLAGSQET